MTDTADIIQVQHHVAQASDNVVGIISYENFQFHQTGKANSLLKKRKTVCQVPSYVRIRKTDECLWFLYYKQVPSFGVYHQKNVDCLDEPVTDRVVHERSGTIHFQLFKNPGPVGADRIDTQIQVVGDCCKVLPLDNRIITWNSRSDNSSWAGCSFFRSMEALRNAAYFPSESGFRPGWS